MIIVPIPPEAVGEAVKEVTSLISKFLGPGFEEAGEIVGDQMRLFRLQRELALLRRAEKIVKDAGFDVKAVNMRILFPLLNAAVLEDNEDMCERWASLLASATDSNNQSALEASFIEILKQLHPTHAYLLDVFYEQVQRKELSPKEWTEHGFVLSYFKDYLKEEVPMFEVALENLLRLNLVCYPTVRLGIANGKEVRVQVPSADILCATNLGHAFTQVCSRGRSLRRTSYGIPGYSISNAFATDGKSLQLGNKIQEHFWEQDKNKEQENTPK